MHGGSFRPSSARELFPSYLLKWRCRRPHLFSRENASPSHHRQSTAPDSPVFFSYAVPNLYLFPPSTSSPRLPLSPPSAATSAVAPPHWTPFPPSRSLPALGSSPSPSLSSAPTKYRRSAPGNPSRFALWVRTPSSSTRMGFSPSFAAAVARYEFSCRRSHPRRGLWRRSEKVAGGESSALCPSLWG